MILARDRYLAQLRPFVDQADLIKVVTGVRRSGKSVLLRQVVDELRQTVPPERIIELNFELTDFADIRSAADLDRHITARLTDTAELHYVFLDEVQTVPDFEIGINSLRARGNVSVFITGSNSSLLSGELATRLAGRFVQFRIWPFSYVEALAVRGLRPIDSTTALLRDFLLWGGLPQRFAFPELDQTRAYLRDVFDSVVLRDIVQRTGLRDVQALESIVEFALENLSRVLSPSSLSGYLRNQGRTISTQTIYSYLRALDASLLFNRVTRYDVRGKTVLANLDKYYATDVGLLATKRVGAGPGLGDLVENAVFVELAARGFDLHTGKTPRGEIDFVAIKNGEPRYVQVAYLLASDAVADREFGAFAPLKDNYPRFVISMDPLTQSRDGITHLTLEEFLLDPPPALR